MTWRERLKKDMKDLDLEVKMVDNCDEWRKRIYVNDYWN